MILISVFSPFTIGVECVKNKGKLSFYRLFSVKERRQVNNNRYVLITKKWTFINMLFSLISTNIGIILTNYYVITTEGPFMSSLYPCLICSGSMIMAYLLTLLLFHGSKICFKCLIPEIRRSCLSPYTMYKIVDYGELREANKSKMNELIPPSDVKRNENYTQVPLSEAKGTSGVWFAA